MLITVTLMGTPKVVMDGQEIVFPYRKAEGLFYYLCVRQSVSRDEVIGIFWADCTESTARKNLRDAIYHLKKLMGEDVIRVEGNNRIGLEPRRIGSIDYQELTQDNFFERYTGDFLGYFYIKNCVEFEEWSTELRENLFSRYQRAAEDRVAALISRGDARALMDFGAGLLRRHILEEGIHREILGELVELDRCSDAQRLYQKLQAALMDELGLEPEEKTVQLMREAAQINAQPLVQRAPAGREEYFFGREQEMVALMRGLRQLEQGRPAAAALLVGEAGVGKSAILRRLKSSLPPQRYAVLSCQCVQTEAELYLKPWQDILAQAEEYGRSAHLASPSRPNLASQNVNAALFATQYELFVQNVFQELVQGMKDRQMVLIIDDVQWMDKASRRLLCNLIFWAGGEKVLIILAGRRELTGELLELTAPLAAKGLLREIPIHRFTLEETREILSQRRPNLLEQEGLLERIYSSTGGNALFLMEFLKELEYGGSLNTLSAKTTGMIQSRLLGLTQEERELLEGISLYPRLATIDELHMLSARPQLELLKGLDHLLSRQLICLNSTYNKQGYAFRHQLIREYIYNGLLEDKRRMLHRQAADCYEEEFLASGDVGLCPMLIYHFSRCQNVYKTYTYRLEYMRAFYAVQHEIYPTVLDDLAEPALALPRLGGEDQLVALAEEIRALNQNAAQADVLRMKVEFLIGRYDLFSGAFDKGLKNISKSIELAQKLNDSKYLMENHLQMIFHAIQIHDLSMLDRHITVCEELLERYRYAQGDVYIVHRLRGVYYLLTLEYDKAEETFQTVIRMVEPLRQRSSSYRVGLAACYNYLGEGRLARGHLDEALEYYRKAVQCCEGKDMVSGMGVFYSNIGYVLYRQGELEEAQRYIDKANHCFSELGAFWGQSKVRCYAALLAIQRGDRREAEEHLRVAWAFARKGGNPSNLALVESVEARLNEAAPDGQQFDLQNDLG